MTDPTPPTPPDATGTFLAELLHAAQKVRAAAAVSTTGVADPPYVECELPECDEVTLAWLGVRFCSRAHATLARRRTDEHTARAAAGLMIRGPMTPQQHAAAGARFVAAAAEPPRVVVLTDPKPATGWRRLVALITRSA